MSALVGRKIIVSKGGSPSAVVASGRTKTLTINAEPIDITSDDDSGVRTLLESDEAQSSIDMSFEGVTKDDTFLSDIINGNFVDDYDILITGIGTVSARFFVTSVAITGTYNDATTFTAEFQSTGTFSYQAA